MSDGHHNCPWPGCTRRVERSLWGCKAHWLMLPLDLRRACLKAWRRGSVAEHMAVLGQIDEWTEAHVR